MNLLLVVLTTVALAVVCLLLFISAESRVVVSQLRGQQALHAASKRWRVSGDSRC